DDLAVAVRLGSTLALDAPHVTTHLDADQKGRRVRVALAPTAPTGTVTLFGVPLPFVDLKVASFGTTDARPDDLAFDLRARACGAGIQVAGAVPRAFEPAPAPGVDVTIDVDQAGPALHDLVAGLAPDVDVSGDAAAGQVHMHGPLLSFRVDATVKNVEGGITGVPARATDAQGSLVFHTDTGKLALDKVTAKILGGALEVPSAEIDTLHGTLAARAQLERVDVTALVPPGDRASVGGRLTGSAHIHGNVRHVVRADDIDLILE